MADEGSYGSLAGMGAGAALGYALGPAGWFAPVIGASLGGTTGGIVGSLFSKKPKRPNIEGEMAKIQALFAELRAQSEANINRQAGQGRRQAASNLAARGTYRSPVAEHTFNALEGERLNAISSANASLAGQEAGMRQSLLQALLGLDASAEDRRMQIEAGRAGALTGLSSNILLAALLAGRKPPTPPPPGGYRDGLYPGGANYPARPVPTPSWYGQG